MKRVRSKYTIVSHIYSNCCFAHAGRDCTN